jgi:hypothetical protein
MSEDPRRKIDRREGLLGIDPKPKKPDPVGTFLNNAMYFALGFVVAAAIFQY